MVYKLYVGTELLDISEKESDIIDTIRECMGKRIRDNFMIIIRTEQGDIIYKVIITPEDFERYEEEYYQNHKEEEKVYGKRRNRNPNNF